MSDYGKLKNAELEAKLKERGLPHGGKKKADMVALLQEDDKKKNESSTVAPAVTATTTTTTGVPDEDKIDWDDDNAETPAASSAPGAAAIAAGGQGQVDNPQTVPNQAVATDPSKTDNLAVKEPSTDAAATVDAAAPEEEKKPEVDFSRGLAATSIEAEIEKRRKRAEKFGTKLEDDKVAQEAIQKLERLKKFGADAAPQGLDEALPERRKRGRDAGDEGSRGGFKRRGGAPVRGNQRRGQRNGPRREGRPNESARGANWMTDKDRADAERRKAKYAS